jgi:hypothetical protein
LSHGQGGLNFRQSRQIDCSQLREVTDMNLNVFSIIAASAISATVALPASASVEVSTRKTQATQSYTPKYLQQSANFYAALDHKLPQ